MQSGIFFFLFRDIAIEGLMIAARGIQKLPRKALSEL